MDLRKAGALLEVSYGLRLVLWALILAVVDTAGAIVIMLVVMSTTFQLPQALASLLLVVSVMASATGLLGQAYCLNVPREARARGRVLLALLFGVLGLVLELSKGIPALAVLAPYSFFAGAIKGLGFVFFLLFLSRLAAYVKALAVSEEARVVLIQSFTLDCVYVGILVLMMATAVWRLGIVFWLCLIGLFLVAWLAFLVFLRYLALIVSVRQAIDAFFVEPPREEIGMV